MRLAIKFGSPILFFLFLSAFAWQTFELAQHVLYRENSIITWLFVFSIDGMGLIYFIADHYHREDNGSSKYLCKDSEDLVKLMAKLCVGASFLCTVIYMSLEFNNFDWTSVPNIFVTISNVLVSIAFPVHVIVFYYIIHMEKMVGYAVRQHPVLVNRVVDALPAKKQELRQTIKETNDPYLDTITEELAAAEEPKKKLASEDGSIPTSQEESPVLDEYDWENRAAVLDAGLDKEVVVVETGSNVHAADCKCVGCRPDLHRRNNDATQLARQNRGRPRRVVR